MDLRELEHMVERWRAMARSCERVGGSREGSAIRSCANELEEFLERAEANYPADAADADCR
jgi:hypothetical protein